MAGVIKRTKIILDSSCWIELAKNSEIGQIIIPAAYDAENLIVPTITAFEVFKVLSREKDENLALRTIEYMKCGKVVPLDMDLSIFAAQVGKKYNLALADSIIYAAALNEHATLWTADKHFKDIAGVRYFDNTC